MLKRKRQRSYDNMCFTFFFYFSMPRFALPNVRTGRRQSRTSHFLFSLQSYYFFFSLSPPKLLAYLFCSVFLFSRSRLLNNTLTDLHTYIPHTHILIHTQTWAVEQSVCSRASACLSLALVLAGALSPPWSTITFSVTRCSDGSMCTT